MMKHFTALCMILLSVMNLKAQQEINLYPGKIPGSKPIPADFKELGPAGDDGIIRVSKVSVPTLAVFLPEKGKSNGTAVIICPGGGYGILAINHEGYSVAKRFNEIGVTAFVLKYRLPNAQIMEDPSIGPMMDAEQAIYTVRKNAAEWNLQSDKIGIMGFSAGGHLASTLTVHYDDVKIENKGKLSLRPDFSVLIYPVISFIDSPHTGSARNLAGTDAKLYDYFSNEKHVTANTPITFMVHANDDDVVPVANSILFNEALVKEKVKAEMHIYQAGGHGFGLHNKTTKDDWFKRLENWMEMNKLL